MIELTAAKNNLRHLHKNLRPAIAYYSYFPLSSLFFGLEWTESDIAVRSILICLLGLKSCNGTEKKRVAHKVDMIYNALMVMVQRGEATLTSLDYRNFGKELRL